MTESESGPSADSAASPVHPRRTWVQVSAGLGLLLLGAGMLIASVVGLFTIHINGIGRFLGCGIVISIGLLVGGWTTLTETPK